MEWLAKLAEYLKLPARYSWATTIVCGLLLFLPDTLLSRLHAKGFIDKYDTIIGIIFLSSAVLAGVNVCIAGWNSLSRWRTRHARASKRLSALNTLDSQEKAVLREFLIQGQNTVRMPIDHPVVAGLLAKGVLVQVGQLWEKSLAGMLISVSQADDIAAWLTLSMLDLPEGKLTEKDIDFALDNRPEFMPEVEQHVEVFHTTWRRRRIGLL